ncbi:TonB-dependent receptor [Peristeroidobacter soli]|uniref:TonB-dependent receptor n=1 Tax=Peristeroidobacter soli TaxID=2497877 RepID=UPI00101BC69C|nr:TonB-dependent receptor [Peristeroidobacter soli]
MAHAHKRRFRPYFSSLIPAASLALAHGAFAQEAAPAAEPAAQNTGGSEGGLEEVVVTGLRSSLQQSVEIKRTAIGSVDAIATEDLGKLPDQNVAESLQRINGVTIERNRGDGQFISVRGLGPQFNVVTLNGRTLATENVGREFSFDVLPSELISGANVYKSPQANLNGASIGATVDIRTVRPLEGDGFSAGGQLRTIYNDLADDFGPSASGLLSFHNDAGDFGVALVASYEKRDLRDDEFTIGAGHVKRGSVLPTDYFYNRTGPNVAPFSNVDMPSNLSPFFVLSERERTGVNLTVQYKPADEVTMSLDGFYSKLDQMDHSTGLAYDFSGGTLVEQVVEGNKAVYQKIENGFVDQIVTRAPRLTETKLIGYNIEWTPGDFRLAFDASASEATREGKEDNYFSTIRRTGMTMEFDRRNGSPIYDYTFSNPNYPNAATDVNNIGAHYENDGGSDYKDETKEFRLDGSWDAGTGIALYGGIGREERDKTIETISMPFSSQCAFCGGGVYVPMPSNIFRPTNMNFFSSHSGNAIRDWVDYDPRALVSALRNYVPTPAQVAAGWVGYVDPTFDPAQSSVVSEDVNLAYFMVEFKGELGSMPYSINAGLRYEGTEFTSSGAAQTLISAVPNGLGQNIITLSPVVPISFDGKYHDFLPSLNVKLDLTDDLVARFSASKVMTRPTLSDLSPAQTILSNPGNETINRGNPDLDPFRAKQFEVGLEWYFADLSVLSGAAFYKDIESFVADATTPQLVDQVVFQVTQPANGKGAKVKGLEFGYQQVFDMLPAPFDGFGVQANYTYVESDASYTNVVSGASFGLQGLSRNSYNFVGFYEKDRIQARLAYTYRENFLQVASGRNGDPEYFDDYGQLDASFGFKVTDAITVSLEGINLNDEKEFIYSTTADRTKEYRTTGRRYILGVRTTF